MQGHLKRIFNIYLLLENNYLLGPNKRYLIYTNNRPVEIRATFSAFASLMLSPKVTCQFSLVKFKKSSSNPLLYG